MAKRKITETMSHDSPGTLVVMTPKVTANSNKVTPKRAPNADGVG